MGNYFDLIAAINAAIKTNGEQGITGASLNAILRDMVAALGAGYQYVGVVAPDAAAPSTDYNAVYLGLTAGTYTNFGGTQVRGGQFGVFTFNGSWTYNVADIASGTFVRCDGEQELTEGEKENARNNIDAASKAEVNAKYTKPALGIPAADLAQAVQTSLGKADAAVRYDVPQVMTQEQAAQARSNIAAASNDDVSQLGQEVDANLKDITDLMSAVSNGNVGFVRTNGAIAPGDTYPTGRYTNPIHLYAGDVVYIKANVGSTGVAVFTECDSSGDNRVVITPGVSGVSEFRYVATKEVYIIISTYLSSQIASGIWLTITNNTAAILFNAAINEIGKVSTDSIKAVIPKIYPNALLPCISFEFDDNTPNDSLVVDLFDELGLRCNFAFIASEANIATLGDKYLDWHRRGYGICSHSVDAKIFNTTNYTRATALAALQTSKNRLVKKGFVVNGFVAPSSQMDAEFVDLVKETYGYGFTTGDGYSGHRKGNPCQQGRQSMEVNSVDFIKQRINVAIAFGYNYTFYGHSANFGITYSGEEWSIAKLREIVEYAISKRDAGLLFIGNTDECVDYFYGGNLYNEHLSGACGTIQPKNRYHYYLHNVTSATIAYSANLPAECEIMLETDASYTSGITFGSGYKFASVPTFGAGETWYIKITQGCVIATKMV